MWKLNTPDIADASRELKTALTEGDGTRVHTITSSQLHGLLNLYARYDARGGQPFRSLLGTRFAEAFRTALHGAYDEVQEGGRLSNLRSRLKVAARKCPYCGFGEVSELDHHLPRSKYKLLAIYARNLIPCCHVCNHRKSALARQAPDAQIAHVYFEQFPAERFLIANVDISPSGLRAAFMIQRSAGMSAPLFARLQFQFERLDLNSRYQPEVDTLMGNLRRPIEDTARGGGDALRTWLAASRATFEVEFGLNDWRTALFDALARSDAFCNGGFKHCFGIRQPGA